MRHTHGGNVYAVTKDGRRPTDFSANVSPLGVPQGVLSAARDALGDAALYPDPACTALRAAIAAHEGVEATQVLCGNGAADLIYRFAYALRPKRALVCAPTFAEYEMALTAAGSDVRKYILREEDGFALTRDILPALEGIDVLCLCNPNNPTGLTIDPALLSEILEACATKNIHVLLDECFIDFLDDPAAHTMVPKLAAYPNMVILKSFTKLYAMPGIRLGYAMCADVALIARIEEAGAPWSVSSVAQAAGLAALRERLYVDEARTLVHEERNFMVQMLRAIGLNPIGEANFLLFKTKPGVVAALLAEGVLVRDCSNFDGLGEGWIRIAIRTRAENMQLLSRLTGCLNG